MESLRVIGMMLPDKRILEKGKREAVDALSPQA